MTEGTKIMEDSADSYRPHEETRKHLIDEALGEIGALRDRLAELEIELQQLQGEALFYRAATVFVLALVAERIWHYFF